MAAKYLPSCINLCWHWKTATDSTAFISGQGRKIKAKQSCSSQQLWPIPGRVEKQITSSWAGIIWADRQVPLPRARHAAGGIYPYIRRPHSHTHTQPPAGIRVCVCRRRRRGYVFLISSARRFLPERVIFCGSVCARNAFSILQTGRQLVGETRKFLRRAHTRPALQHLRRLCTAGIDEGRMGQKNSKTFARLVLEGSTRGELFIWLGLSE